MDKATVDKGTSDKDLTTYLHETDFRLYASGVYQGRIRFEQDRILFAKVDARRRTQMQVDVLPDAHGFVLPFAHIHKSLAAYVGGEWSGDKVTLDNGDVYEQHLTYTGVVRGADASSVRGPVDDVAGGSVTAQVWARRIETAVDIVTVDDEVIAFVCPNRYGMEVLVKAGYEDLTPLRVYQDERLSQPGYGIDALGTRLIPMRDGVRLATDVYLPQDLSGDSAAGTTSVMARFPTILVRTCYDRKRNQNALTRWVNKGYAVVIQDVRGRSDSEGDLMPFYFERDDGSDTIDWIAAQPWSDGNVGMWGASYLGFVVVSAATSGNPHLKAVVDEVNVGSPFVDTVRRGGTVCSWPLLCWTLAQSVSNRTDFDVFAGKTVSPEVAVDTRPIREIPQKTIGKASGPWDLWANHPDYDDFWRNCTFSERGSAVQVPMFVISGWYDGDSAGVSETWRMLTHHDVPNRKIWLGPWEHGPNRARDFEGQPLGLDAVVYHYDVQVLRWFDRFLKGVKNGIDEEPRASYFVVGENRWHTAEDWTPPEAVVTPFYLGSGRRANSRNGDGWLTSGSQVGVDADMFVYDPLQPFDDSGERQPDNLNVYEVRNDILIYTSQALMDPLTVAGELSAEIYAASTAVDTDWVATLADVDEKGNSIRLSSYIVRAKYRNGVDAPELLTPGKVEKYDIFLPNVGHRFEVGHRIRFTITSSCKMVAFPNSNTGLNPYDDPEPVSATQTVYHTKEYPSHVKLPVLP